MMRRIAVVAALTLISMVNAPSASADDVAYCWYEGGGNRGGAGQIHCRLAGGDVVTYTDRREVPGPLFPAVGTDSTGTCWYERSEFTGWYLVGQNGTDALLQFDPDGIPGGPRIADAWVRRCDGEPVDTTTIAEIVWEVLASFDFELPDVALTPSTGITGLATYIEVDPPPVFVETVVSPGSTIEVEFSVSLVSIDWGDDILSEVTPELYPLLSGYPSGEITHTYETKGHYDPQVDYVWQVRWRVDGGPWQLILDVEPTTWTQAYQVDELVTRVTG